jgi:hypothetical protein
MASETQTTVVLRGPKISTGEIVFSEQPVSKPVPQTTTSDAVASTKADPNRSVREDALVAEIERLRLRMGRVAEYVDNYDGDIAGAIRDALNMDDPTWDTD